MKSSSYIDLWLVIFLSLIGLALIWLSPLQSYPFALIPYLLLFFLPGYALITAIKPHYGLVARIIIGFLLGLILLIFLPLTFNYFKIGHLELIPTLLFLLAIIISLVAILRRRRTLKDLEGQLTLDESIKRLKEIKTKAEEETIPNKETEEYTPIPAEVEEPSQKNKMSVMRLYDTGEKPKPDKLKKEEKIADKKPLKDMILRNKEEEKSGEKTIPLPIEHPVKREDLLNAFPKEIGKPVWLDHINDDQGFRNWDLLLALLISGLAVSFSYYNPLRTPLLTTIISYTVVLFTVAYTLLVVIFPDRRRIGLLKRIAVSSLITILILILVLIFENSNVITTLPLPLILLLALATLLLVLVAALRRRSLPPESTELSLEEIIRRAEKLEILVEHDEETLQALKELEKETEQEPPKEEKKPTKEKEPLEEIPVIIVEHDKEEQKEEWEPIIIEHDEEDETEETPYIIVEHEEEEEEEEPTKREVEQEEPHHDKYESKPSLLSTEEAVKVDKDLAYPAEEDSEPKNSEKKETETKSKIPPKKKIETKFEPPIKEEKKVKVGKKRFELVKEQFINYGDLILVPLIACLLIIYFIIPLFPKTPLTVTVSNYLLFILAGYSLVFALYPKKFDLNILVGGILIGNLLVVAYNTALFFNNLTISSESISLWLLIFILILCLIAYFRRGRATHEEKEQPKEEFEKSNIANLITDVIKEREENKEKPKPTEPKEDPFLDLRSRSKPEKKVKTDKTTDSSKPSEGEPKTEVILSVILIIVLVLTISATAIYIIKP